MPSAAYSFAMTNLDVSTPDAATVEHWYRHRTEIENIFRAPNTAALYGTYPPAPLIGVPACLIRHGGQLTLRPPPDDHLLAEIPALPTPS